LNTRLVSGDYELRGRKIRKGQGMLMMIGAANRDPAQFTDPDQLDITRRDNKHLAFGYGLHFCQGAPLARLEAQIAFNTVLDRFPGFKLRDKEVKWRENMSVRCPQTLLADF
jgi:cytochrome P450